MVYRVVVLGGGIAGLYAAYQTILQDPHARVTVLEKANYWGGRIRTVRYDGVVMDAGAGRFNENHKQLLQLLQDLGFDKSTDFFPLGTKKQYVKDGKPVSFNTTQHIQKLIEIGKTKDPNHLKNTTLKMFMQEVFQVSLVDEIIYSFGYNTEFDLMNAYDALQVFQTDFMDSIQYYALKGGLDRLVKRLVERLRSSGRCKLLLHQDVTHIDRHWITTAKGRKFNCDIAFVCLTKSAVQHIQGFATNTALTSTMKSLGKGELLRVFARFPMGAQGRVWFHDVPRSTTNNMVRYVIPINADKGLVMAAYTDGSYAREWMTLSKTMLPSTIMTHLRTVYPEKQIPDPLWVRSFYWDEGTHCWLPGSKKYKNTKSTLEKYGYLVCGEMVSDHNQAWIEGALDSVSSCMHLL